MKVNHVYKKAFRRIVVPLNHGNNEGKSCVHFLYFHCVKVRYLVGAAKSGNTVKSKDCFWKLSPIHRTHVQFTFLISYF